MCVCYSLVWRTQSISGFVCPQKKEHRPGITPVPDRCQIGADTCGTYMRHYNYMDECGSPTGYCAFCGVLCVFVGKECLLICDVLDDRCIGFGLVCWLFGGSVVEVLVTLFVPLLLQLLVMPGLCCFFHVTHTCGTVSVRPLHLIGELECACAAHATSKACAILQTNLSLTLVPATAIHSMPCPGHDHAMHL